MINLAQIDYSPYDKTTLTIELTGHDQQMLVGTYLDPNQFRFIRDKILYGMLGGNVESFPKSIKKLIKSGDRTILIDDKGDKSIVKRDSRELRDNPYIGFLMVIIKHILYYYRKQPKAYTNICILLDLLYEPTKEIYLYGVIEGLVGFDVLDELFDMMRNLINDNSHI